MTRQREAALPVADVDVGDHAGAAEIDTGDTGGGRIDATYGDTTKPLVVEVPVGQGQHDEAVVAAVVEPLLGGVGRADVGLAVVIRLGDPMRAAAGVETDGDVEAGRQVRVDLGIAGEGEVGAA